MAPAVFCKSSSRYFAAVRTREDTASRQHQLWSWPSDLSSARLDDTCTRFQLTKQIHSLHPVAAGRPSPENSADQQAQQQLDQPQESGSTLGLALVHSDATVQLGTGSSEECQPAQGSNSLGTTVAAAASQQHLVLTYIDRDDKLQVELLTLQVRSSLL